MRNTWRIDFKSSVQENRAKNNNNKKMCHWPNAGTHEGENKKRSKLNPQPLNSIAQSQCLPTIAFMRLSYFMFCYLCVSSELICTCKLLEDR